MTEPSKERLEEIVNDPTINQGSTFAKMAHRLLALEAQEPVISVIFKDGWPIPETVGIVAGGEKLPDGVHEFYAAPQPAEGQAPVSDDYRLRIAAALESLLWSNVALGNKAVLQAAIETLRAAQPAPVAASTEYLPCDVRVGESVTIKKGNEVSTLLEVLRVQDAKSCGKYDFLIDSAGAPVAQPVQVPDDKQLRALFDAWFASDCSFDRSPDATEEDNIAWRESYWYVWQRCRAAMLKAEPVSQPYKLPDGYVLVPVEPTMPMLDEFDSIIDYGAEDSKDAWSRMLAAAPQPVAVVDERAAFNSWSNEDNLPIAGVGAKNAAWLAWQARSALQPSSGALQLPDGLPPMEHLDIIKFNADCAMENPDSIYANEFFLSLDEIFGEKGNYSLPVQAKAISVLIAEIFRIHGYKSAPQEPTK